MDPFSKKTAPAKRHRAVIDRPQSQPDPPVARCQRMSCAPIGPAQPIAAKPAIQNRATPMSKYHAGVGPVGVTAN